MEKVIIKCSFCKRTETEIRKDNGHIIAMENRPDVCICNVCVTLARSGKMDDVNNPPKQIVTYVNQGESDE